MKKIELVSLKTQDVKHWLVEFYIEADSELDIRQFLHEAKKNLLIK
jgi:hypothetical protein